MLNRGCTSPQARVRRAAVVRRLAERSWKGRPEWVRAPYVKDALAPWWDFVSTTLHVEWGGKLGGPPSKARVLPATHRAEYREGTVKRTPARGVK